MVFLQYIGVASSEAGFTYTRHDPVYHYHSVFDSQRWQEVYGDPGFERHVAIAKHAGLEVLRLSDDIILPFNTTYPSAYCRAEELAKTSSLEVDFAPLRRSVQALHAASARLDIEKTAAEVNLKKMLGKLKQGQHQTCQLICKLLRLVGKECKKCEEAESPSSVLPKRQLLKAIKRVQAANRKFIEFERGFISKEGIKDREWCKHLGVALGKWSGYGATTSPGLAEAMTVDRDAVAARLKVLIDELTEKISG